MTSVLALKLPLAPLLVVAASLVGRLCGVHDSRGSWSPCPW